MISVTRAERSVLSDWWLTVDRGMLLAIGALIAYGIMLVAAASSSVAIRIGIDANHFVIRHLTMLVPAMTVMFAMSLLNPRWVWRVASCVMLVSLVIMVIIPFVGMEIKGAQRWLHIFGLSIQPSEFVKPSFAVVAAWLMAQQKEKMNFPGNIVTACLYLLILALLLLQPDLGMSVVITAMFAAQIFLAGLPFRYLVVFGLLGIAGICLA
jgi:cell division protein FtsW